jgi:hypothetical protein
MLSFNLASSGQIIISASRSAAFTNESNNRRA